ncbi:MBL fold metallo-hydrolase [bacterium]|nr:MBL fold metallo-hydrolase [bacterium]
MIAISLQSGSSGNCLYIEANGVKLLFDAGISSLEAGRRLAAFDRDIKDVDALIISHDHGDHIRHAGVFQRRYNIPLYLTEPTLNFANAKMKLGKLHDLNFFKSGDSLTFKEVSVQSIPCPHDSADGSVFVINSQGKKLGIITDLGHVTQELRDIIPTLDAVFLESNYDPGMLQEGAYPEFLKKRITGLHGHLSNLEAAELLLSGERLQWACLAHISNNNNDPSTALKTHREVLGNDLQLYTASRFEASGAFSL